MAEKIMKTRIIHKHDTEENWNKATNFIPKQGELIIYDKDATYDYERFKIGDGETNVNSLPFVTDNLGLTTIPDIDTIRSNAANGQTAYEMLADVEALLANI